MPRNVTVTFDDGSSHVYQSVPDDATPEQVQARAAQDFAGLKVSALDGGRGPPSDSPKNALLNVIDKMTPSMLSGDFLRAAGHHLMKPLHGAAQLIENTAATGANMLPDNPVSRYISDTAQHDNQALAENERQYQARTPSNANALLGAGAGEVLPMLVGGGATKLGGAGDYVAGKLGELVPEGIRSASPLAAKLAAKATSGAVQGAVVGAVAPVTDMQAPTISDLVSPNAPRAPEYWSEKAKQVGAGVAGGAALPLMGSAVAGAGNKLVALFKSDPEQGAQELMKALDVTPDQLPAAIAKLRGAPEFVPGSKPTVAQALSLPQASILDRVVSAGPGGEKLRQAAIAQAEARMNALTDIAPVSTNGFADARTDLGNAISRAVTPEERAISQRIGNMYENIDPNGAAQIPLPVADMQSAVNKYLGAGSFGDNNAPMAAVKTARELSPQVETYPGGIRGAAGAPIASPRPATWGEVNQLRGSLNEAWNQARNNGDRQAAAALNAQKQALDSAIQEHLPPEQLAQFMEANASHAAKMDRFHTGPQAAIFATRNGVPKAQGAEVSNLFWNGSPGIADDVTAFRKLVDDNPSLLGQFRSLVTTDAAEKAAQGGNLGQRYVDWTRNRLPGLRNAFSPEEVQTFQNIADDISRGASANKLGLGIGSNTYQNASNALDVGLLGSPLAKAAANRVPYLRAIAEPARAALAESATTAKAARLADLLSDAKGAADALETQTPTAIAQAVQHANLQGKRIFGGKIPGMNLTLQDFATLVGARMAASAAGGAPPMQGRNAITDALAGDAGSSQNALIDAASTPQGARAALPNIGANGYTNNLAQQFGPTNARAARLPAPTANVLSDLSSKRGAPRNALAELLGQR